MPFAAHQPVPRGNTASRRHPTLCAHNRWFAHSTTSAKLYSETMQILFIHQNFPGQFKFLAPALAQRGHQVFALGVGKQPGVVRWQGVQVVRYTTQRGSTPGIHPWLADTETKTIRAEACFRAALQLKAQGVNPDVIVAHPGWGESLFLKAVWPQARLGIYSEFFYQTEGSDVGFDPEFPVADPAADACRIRMKNLFNLLHFEVADAGISPTHWQASTFPEPFRAKIAVIHDGIDTEALQPNPGVSLTVSRTDGSQRVLTRADEVITFVNRNLEPYRGYHIFMRALPDILKRRPNAHVVLVGGNDVSYGAKPNPATHGEKSWKDIFLAENAGRISAEDMRRVHFVGKLPYPAFVGLLQLSTVHVYWTYPFVLSWSLLEAMSVGCAIVASDTQPLQEAIRHGETGQLVNFFDVLGLVNGVCAVLDDPALRTRLGAQARRFAQTHYDLKSVCLPQQLDWVEGLAA